MRIAYLVDVALESGGLLVGHVGCLVRFDLFDEESWVVCPGVCGLRQVHGRLWFK